jgi:hypothetical protein
MYWKLIKGAMPVMMICALLTATGCNIIPEKTVECVDCEGFGSTKWHQLKQRPINRGLLAVLLEVIDLEDPVEIGATTTYVITATNQGSLAGKNVTITCKLEDTQQHVSNSGATKGTVTGQTIKFAPLPSLAPKDTATWKLVIKAVKVGDVRFSVQMDEDQLTRPVNETEATNQY